MKHESPKSERTRERCYRGIHEDPDNSGMCIYCAVILYPEPNEDPNSYRRSQGWPDVPLWPDIEATWKSLKILSRKIRRDAHGR
jgi:hypothetical protein